MTLTLYYHPLAAYCHKVLIALYEAGTAFDKALVDLGDPAARAAHIARWPTGKMPQLHDSRHDRLIAETSIIIEYLDRHYPAPRLLLPADPEARLEVRLWDRLFDLYVSEPMQKIVGDRLRPDGQKDPAGLAEARRTLDMAYAMIDGQVARGGWAVGSDFTMADCAATPALFYASIIHPMAGAHSHLRDYFDRLMSRPSVERVIAEARPYFSFFPFNQDIPDRFR